MEEFRKICRWLHRELGFFAVGLTLVYAISGIVLNHSHHWDPNYSPTEDSWFIEAPGTGRTEDIREMVISSLQINVPVENTWRASKTEFQVFVDRGQYDINLETGQVLKSGFKKRPFLFDLNFMHLNAGKSFWTVVADVFAGIMIVLAISGVFLIKGRRGLLGRGGVLMVVGIILPIVYALLQRN